MIGREERERRIAVFRRAAPFFGTVQPAGFLRESDRFGNMLRSPAEGIFKPHWATHAFSVASMLSSPYADQIQHLPDRSWTMAYSPKAGGLQVASNVALINCMQDKEPLLILRQTSDKSSSKGSS